MKMQKLSDEHMDNPSLMGFGTFKVDNSKVIINALKIGYHNSAIITCFFITEETALVPSPLQHFEVTMRSSKGTRPAIAGTVLTPISSQHFQMTILCGK